MKQDFSAYIISVLSCILEPQFGDTVHIFISEKSQKLLAQETQAIHVNSLKWSAAKPPTNPCSVVWCEYRFQYVTTIHLCIHELAHGSFDCLRSNLNFFVAVIF